MNGLSLWVPTVMVLVGLLWNNTRIDKLSEKMDAAREANHKDALAIVSAMTELHERVAKVEARQGT